MSDVTVEQAKEALHILQEEGGCECEHAWEKKNDAYSVLNAYGKHLCDVMRQFRAYLNNAGHFENMTDDDMFMLVSVTDMTVYLSEKYMALDWDADRRVLIEIEHAADTDAEFLNYMRQKLIEKLSLHIDNCTQKIAFWEDQRKDYEKKLLYVREYMG
jgi:hypothetical protein